MQLTDRLLVPNRAYRNGRFQDSSRTIPEERAVAMSYNGTTQAVMMATPTDLEDFAIGFSITENIISDISEIEEISIVEFSTGIDVQIRLTLEPEQKLAARRRFMAGPVGCGLCGIDSIEQALRPLPDLKSGTKQFTPQNIIDAVSSLSGAQHLNRETRAVHGAGFFTTEDGLIALREDVGRHNALDKLIGHLVRSRQNNDGIVALTSRVSVEMVQKTIIYGAPVLAAISAPSALALKTAEQANLTMVALVRGDEFDVYTHSERITDC